MRTDYDNFVMIGAPAFVLQLNRTLSLHHLYLPDAQFGGCILTSIFIAIYTSKLFIFVSSNYNFLRTLHLQTFIISNACRGWRRLAWSTSDNQLRHLILPFSFIEPSSLDFYKPTRLCCHHQVLFNIVRQVVRSRLFRKEGIVKKLPLTCYFILALL